MIPTVMTVFAFCLGAVIGSFLNACIHRMPRNLRLDEPKRSFCPACNTTIKWFHNLPLVSWIFLRGRCAYCGAPIAFRYFLVEFLTAVGFLAIWILFPPSVAIAYWVFYSLLLVATFIDFEHYIIPDEITLGGAAAGIVASLIVPELVGATTWWQGGLVSLASAGLGYGSLWAVVEAGKLAFGKKRLVVDPPEPSELRGDGTEVSLTMGGESWALEEMFSRESDELILHGTNWSLNGTPAPDGELRLRYDRWIFDRTEMLLSEPVWVTGTVSSVVIPREAMGFGDVKFMACIGAFLGWQALLFVLMVSSVVGAVVGGLTLVVTRGQSGGKIPFGPYLALGAIVWMLVGAGLVEWYFGLLKITAP